MLKLWHISIWILGLQVGNSLTLPLHNMLAGNEARDVIGLYSLGPLSLAAGASPLLYGVLFQATKMVGTPDGNGCVICLFTLL